ncbi:MAG: hypothetical protein AB7G13_00380 [Lautropia sp.]
MQALRLDETRGRTEQVGDGIGQVRFNDYWGAGRKVLPDPQAFLVHLEDSGSVLKTHMHDVDQFQVAAIGGGRMGARRWNALSVHYADAFTLYGPIVRGESGLSFYTLRMAHGGGNWSMPEARALMPNGRPGRNLMVDVDVRQPLPAPGVVERVYLADPAFDGLAIAQLRMGPDAQTDGYAPEGGQYMLVCAGALVDENGKMFDPQALLLLNAGEPAPQLRAGPAGAFVVVMQFPRPTQRKGSDPRSLADRPEHYAFSSRIHTL